MRFPLPEWRRRRPDWTIGRAYWRGVCFIGDAGIPPAVAYPPSLASPGLAPHQAREDPAFDRGEAGIAAPARAGLVDGLDQGDSAGIEHQDAVGQGHGL